MISEPEILDVREPPGKAMGKVAELWKPIEGTNKIMCTACARYCKIGEGQVGLCGIRGVHEGKLWLYVYGRVITGHVDPILDGNTKPVEEIIAGDTLQSLAVGHGVTLPAVVTSAGNRRAATFRVSVSGLRDPFFATQEHPVLTSTGWRPVESLIPGDAVLISRETSARITPPRNSIAIPDHSASIHPGATSRFWKEWRSFSGSSSRYEWARVRSVRAEALREHVYSFECVIRKSDSFPNNAPSPTGGVGDESGRLLSISIPVRFSEFDHSTCPDSNARPTTWCLPPSEAAVSAR